MFSPKITTTCLIGVVVAMSSPCFAVDGGASALAVDTVTAASTATVAAVHAPSSERRRRHMLGFSPTCPPGRGNSVGGSGESGEQGPAVVVRGTGDAGQCEEVATAEW